MHIVMAFDIFIVDGEMVDPEANCTSSASSVSCHGTSQ